MSTPVDEPRVVVVAPTFNNAATLRDVLHRIAATGLPMIVVDDGSTDDTPAVLREFHRVLPRSVVLTHDRNRGKAAALQTGFDAAREHGHTHAVTIDTDGQLDPEQIPDLVDAARRHPHALVIGARDDRRSDYPARSRLGRRLSNLFIRMESGARVEDSQCGFRVYPLGLLSAVRPRAGRYAFETEIVTRAGWAGCPIVQVPVECRYPPGEERVSHFRPWVDSLRGIALHARLLGRALVPWPHPKWPGREVALREGTALTPKEHVSWSRRIWAWISPREAWRQLRRDRIGRTELSAGLAVGAFIANLPLYPFQTLAAVYTAGRLHLHPLAVVLGAQLSMPPINAVLIIAAIGLGHLILHGTTPTLSDFNFFELRWQQWEHLFRRLLLEWLIGGTIIGLGCAALVFVVTNLAFRLFTRRVEPSRQTARDVP